MQCNEARQRLEALKGRSEAATGELRQHLENCDACHDYARECLLVDLLAGLPVPDPDAGMEDRVLRRALRGPRIPRAGLHARWALATAASVVLAVVVTLQFYPAGSSHTPAEGGPIQASVVEVEPQQTRMVSVLLSSSRVLNDARITVQLDDNLELEGYRNVHNLQWRTSLKSGANRLSLPVRLLKGRSGRITVTVEHEGSSKRFTVEVNAAPAKPDQKLSMV